MLIKRASKAPGEGQRRTRCYSWHCLQLLRSRARGSARTPVVGREGVRPTGRQRGGVDGMFAPHVHAPFSARTQSNRAVSLSARGFPPKLEPELCELRRLLLF